jgi:hypothetical protein
VNCPTNGSRAKEKKIKEILLLFFEDGRKEKEEGRRKKMKVD